MNRKPGYHLPTSHHLMLKPSFKQGSAAIPPSAARSIVSASRQDSGSPQSRGSKPSKYQVVSTFMFTPNDLKITPSLRTHDISLNDEHILRLIGTCWIKELALRINLRYKNITNSRSHVYRISTRAYCVAMVYFHRFYMFHSFGTFDPVHLATAALFLAAKCEECPKRLIHFVHPLWKVQNPKDTRPLNHDDELLIMDLITSMETSLLRTLSFELKFNMCHVEVIQAPFSDDLKKAAFHMCTDLLQYTTACLVHDYKVLAAAAFLAASTYMNIDMALTYGEMWYDKVAPGVNFGVLVEIVDVLGNSYTRHQKLFPKLPGVKAFLQKTVVAKDEGFSKPHHRVSSVNKSQSETTAYYSHREEPPIKQRKVDSTAPSQKHYPAEQYERRHKSKGEHEIKSSAPSDRHVRRESDRVHKEKHREHRSKSERSIPNPVYPADQRYMHSSAQAGNDYRSKAANIQMFALETQQKAVNKDFEEGEIE